MTEDLFVFNLYIFLARRKFSDTACGYEKYSSALPNGHLQGNVSKYRIEKVSWCLDICFLCIMGTFGGVSIWVGWLFCYRHILPSAHYKFYNFIQMFLHFPLCNAARKRPFSVQRHFTLLLWVQVFQNTYLTLHVFYSVTLKDVGMSYGHE